MFLRKTCLDAFLSSFPEFLKTHLNVFSIQIHHQIENLILLRNLLDSYSLRSLEPLLFVKKNPTICQYENNQLGLFSRLYGDCVHIYYPQSLAAKAEALELFSVKKKLISSHSGTVNLQLDNDSRVAMKLMSFRTMSSKELANQQAIFIPLKSDILINLETSTHISRSLSLVYRLFSFTFSHLNLGTRFL